MSNNANQPAFPRPYSHDERPSGVYEGDRPETFQAQNGLTKREYFAAMAMTAYLQQPSYYSHTDQLAKKCIELADELLKQLNQ